MEYIFSLSQPIGLLVSLLIFIATIFLLKVECGWDPLFMMFGAILSVVSQTMLSFPKIFTIAQPMITEKGNILFSSSPSFHQWYVPTVFLFSMFGGVLFAIGFFGYIWQKRKR
jgi:hypothetical protein